MVRHPHSAGGWAVRPTFSHLKETQMTVIETFSAATRPLAWRRTTVFLVRTRRLINRWIAARIAYRERQAALAALRRLDDRQLRDFGLYRSQIDFGLDEAAQERSRMQLGLRAPRR
jgi:uncharacterized protein YjiS (DUF1127 family)